MDKTKTIELNGKIPLKDFLLCTPYESRNNRDLKNIDPYFLYDAR